MHKYINKLVKIINNNDMPSMPNKISKFNDGIKKIENWQLNDELYVLFKKSHKHIEIANENADELKAILCNKMFEIFLNIYINNIVNKGNINNWNNKLNGNKYK